MKRGKLRKNISLLKIIASSFRLRPKYLLLFTFNTLLGWANSFFFLLDRLFFPSIRKKQLDRPVFLIGHLRSGTTFLHRFISQNCSSLRTCYLWEMIIPSSSLKRLLKPFLPLFNKIKLDKVYNPKIHKTGLQKEETDDIALYFRYLDGMLSWIYFHAWQQFHSVEQLHDSLLQTCRQSNFVPFLTRLYRGLSFESGKRIMSKSFSSLYNLEAIKTGHPDARIIILIRDPREAIPSMMSLQESVQTKMHGKKNLEKNREKYFQNLYQLSLHYYAQLEKTYAEFRDHPDYLFISYEDLKNNFAETISIILEHSEIRPDIKLKEAITRQLAKQAKFSSQHEYHPERFGLSNEKIMLDVPFYKKFINTKLYNAES